MLRANDLNNPFFFTYHSNLFKSLAPLHYNHKVYDFSLNLYVDRGVCGRHTITLTLMLHKLCVL